MPTIEVTTARDQKNFSYSEWYTQAPRPELSFLKLPQKYDFDLEKMQNELMRIQHKVPFQPFMVGRERKRPRRSYQGIGLTHRKNAQDPYYDSFQMDSQGSKISPEDYFQNQQSIRLDETMYTERNDLWDGYLGEVLNQFQSPMTKVRFLKLSPKGVMPSHVDFPHYEQIKLHSYITTNSHVYVQVDKDIFQIPADGSFYWFDTGRYHAVWNDGQTDRIDLCVNLRLYFDHQGNAMRPLETPVTEVILNEPL